MNARKTVLVTGGAGFVGSHLCERLHGLGFRVISLDNYFTGLTENHVPGVEYRNGHTKDIEKHIPEAVEVIYHLGEYSRVEQSVLEPDIVHDLNTLGTRGVIEYWKKRKCKLVYAGSSTKFGDHGAARHTSPYASTKAENSELVRDIGKAEKLPYAITYFYNVYGPRERSGVYGTVVEHFKRMYLAGTPCAVVKPGTQVRNFTHVDDIVDGLIKVGAEGQGDEYGLGNTQAFSIFDVANLFGFGKNIVMFPERPGNRLTSGLDLTKSRAVGWEAQRSLASYIEEFTRTHTRRALREKRILVFSTTMHPVAGLAEDAFLDLAKALPDVSFDVVTSRFTKERAVSPAPNITLHPVGFGMTADKFLLPFFGPIKALSLWRKDKYLFTWSLMASYAALAGIFFKSIVRAPLLITLADQSLDDLPFLQRASLSLMLSRADQVYGTHGAQEKDAMKSGGVTLPRNSLGEGDAFANALRYAYADVIRRVEESKKKSPKKILIFSLAYYPKHIGGAEVSIKEITDRINPAEYEFHMVTNRFDSTLPKEEKIGNVYVHRIGITTPNPKMADLKRWPLHLNKVLFQITSVWKVLELHRVHRFDGTWAMMAHSCGIPAGLFKMLNPKVGYLLNLQEGDPPQYIERTMSVVWPLFKNAFTRADIVQPLSTYLADWARRMGHRGAIEVIPNGADIQFFTTPVSDVLIREVTDALNKKEGDVLLVTTSRLVHKNAVDDVIRALPSLPTQVRFIVLGTGSDEDMLKNLTKSLGLEDRVVFLGHVAHADMMKYLKVSDIFIRPSRSEGFGASFAEAMATGIPIVATQEGGIADFLFDEQRNPEKPTTGWAVEKDSPEQIVTAITDIMQNPEKVRRVVSEARSMVLQKYDWDVIARDMEKKVLRKL
ncbi:NAD-dependent epimerase/dehydratase family protein [Patescibacteria group bacterium]|nr:NAD-dependent epimerase/dehydratase family protein [Patescibacteria group bacterium]